MSYEAMQTGREELTQQGKEIAKRGQGSEAVRKKCKIKSWSQESKQRRLGER